MGRKGRKNNGDARREARRAASAGRALALDGQTARQRLRALDAGAARERARLAAVLEEAGQG